MRSLVEATREERAPAEYVPQYGLAPQTSDEPLVVVTWSKWGKHRLYVNTPDGDRVGWVDLDTGERSLAIPGLASEFEAAIQQQPEDAYLPRRGIAAPAHQSRTPGRAVRRFEPLPTDLVAPRPGEHMVAEELDRLVALDQGWAYINSIPVGTNDSDIDHLVVGPGGVFTIHARHHHDGTVWVAEDELMVDGSWTQDVSDSRHEAERASTLLSSTARTTVTVKGLVVPVGVAELTVDEPPDDVGVIDGSQLVDFLMSQPAVLDAYTIALVMTCARLSTTWRASTTA